MSADLIGKEQRLVEFTFAQPLDMQWDGDNQINRAERWKSIGHQAGEWGGQRDFASVLEEANGILQRGPIRIEGPRFGIGGGTCVARLAEMMWTVGRGQWRDKRAIATSAPERIGWCDRAPTSGAEVWYWVAG